MARTLLDLAKSLERRAASVSSVGNEKAKAVVTAIIMDFANVSPVDTSLFVSNWQVTINGIPLDIRPAYFYGALGSSGEASARAMVESAMVSIAQKKPGDIVYISNLLPYARRLDQGYSTQFAGGFSARAALIARNVVSKKNG